VQAHTLAEVGILDTVLLRAYSETILPIFIQIGSYLTDKEQKISWHSFFLRHGVLSAVHYTTIPLKITTTDGCHTQ